MEPLAAHGQRGFDIFALPFFGTVFARRCFAMGDHGDDFATKYLGIKFERLSAVTGEAEIGYVRTSSSLS